MVPGLWEITLQTRTPALGAPLTHTICIERAVLTRPDPPKSNTRDDCQVSVDPAAANETAYSVRCAKRKALSASRVTYLGDRFEGTITIHDQNGDVQQTYTGHRVDDCEPLLPAPPIPAPAARQH
jgi:hypothetical protein